MTDRIDRIRLNMLAAERGRRPSPGAGRRLGIVYPNGYRVAMSNLAFQWLTFAADNHPDFFAERIFLPEGEMATAYEKQGAALRLLESGAPASDCLAWLVTLSFENDYPNLVRLMRMARIEPLAADRDARAPLIVLGGACPSLNPEPVAPFADVILLGEGDGALQPFLDRLAAFRGQGDRSQFLESLADLPFAYLPGSARSGTRKVTLLRESTIDRAKTYTHILTPDTEFPDVLLIETFRGCTARCRFCAAGHLYLPPRERSADFTLPDHGQRAVGLVGAGISGHSEIETWIAQAAERGRVGISSVRHGTLSESALALLVEQGTRSVAIAPEAGTERLRRVCNKPLSDDAVVDEALRMVRAGFVKLKLYFMVGLPTETSEDIEAIAAVSVRIRDSVMPLWRERKRTGQIDLSINPFVPKAHTPFQWAPFIAKGRYDAIRKSLQTALGREGNIHLQFESYREAKLQALFSMGGREVFDLVLALGRGENPSASFRQWKGDIDGTIHRTRQTDEALPWDFIDPGIDRSFFVREWERALSEKISPECKVGFCRLCGLCQ